MRTDDLHYDLPTERIAQSPVEPRDSARLLVDRGATAPPLDARVSDLAGFLEPGDLLVANTTRVMPARVPIVRDTGGGGEVLLLEEAPTNGDQPSTSGSAGWWLALCRPSRKLREGSVVRSAHGSLAFEVGRAMGEGRRLVRPLVDPQDLPAALNDAGDMPLPPYIHQRPADPERYQTTFADRAASAAAPTAGLHLTPSVFASLEARGVATAFVELVVGLDTFRPVTTDLLEEHPIHTEQYDVAESTWQAVIDTRRRGGRVLAVGTTTVRSLESVAATGDLRGRTALFITPGHRFGAVDRMVTNFHLPRSSLLALVEAFIGPRWKDLYVQALERNYRFLSFGDAMLLTGGTP